MGLFGSGIVQGIFDDEESHATETASDVTCVIVAEADILARAGLFTHAGATDEPISLRYEAAVREPNTDQVWYLPEKVLHVTGRMLDMTTLCTHHRRRRNK